MKHLWRRLRPHVSSALALSALAVFYASVYYCAGMAPTTIANVMLGAAILLASAAILTRRQT